MAVSPIDSKGKVDNDTVYMVYAGTEPKEPADIGTDVKLDYLESSMIKLKLTPKMSNFMMNIKIYPKTIRHEFPYNTVKNSQFDEANAWTAAVLKKETINMFMVQDIV